MANYGTQTIGAGVQSIEVAVQGLLVTLAGGELAVSTMAYLSSTAGNTCNVKSALYNSTTLALVYQSDQFSFTDDAGGWKAIPWTGITPAAGNYYLTVSASFLSGGANDTRINVDTVTASANYRRQSNGASGYPVLADPFAPDAGTFTQNPSLYLVTSGGAVSANTYSRSHARHAHHIRQGRLS